MGGYRSRSWKVPMVRLLFLASLAGLMGGCNRSVMVHLRPAPGGVDPQTYTARLDAGDPKALGGTRVDAVMECPAGTTPNEVVICVGNSRSCATLATRPPVAGVTVLHKCGVADAPAGGGLGPSPGGR